MEHTAVWTRELTLLPALLRLVMAAIMGGLIGSERGKHGRAAGMRTHILVAIGSSLTALVGLYTVDVLGFTADPLRVGAQVISGIGFLGAGTILVKDRFQVTGLTTAAGLWATAAIGLAVGIGFYEPALLAGVLVLAANTFLSSMERSMLGHSSSCHIYAELNDINRVNDFLDLVVEAYHADHVQVTPAQSGIAGNVGIEIEVYPEQKTEVNAICRDLSANDFIAFAVNLT